LSNIFEDLFVLELANNHWGSVSRGIRIIETFSSIAHQYGIRAAIKLQFRDVDHFIHKDHISNKDIRYIRKTVETKLTFDDYAALVTKIRMNDCIPMATPFDETSVDWCKDLDLPIIKVASSDLSDKSLLSHIELLRKPVIASTGGASVEEIDTFVERFENQGIPIALNHCVSLYPTENHDLQLNQIDFLKTRYEQCTIGLSTHEYKDWRSSVAIAYAKGARTFERHIDIANPEQGVSPYCTLPHDCKEWFEAFKLAKEMCGRPGDYRRTKYEEKMYLDKLKRGLYAKRDLKRGDSLTLESCYLAIPCLPDQLSTDDFVDGLKTASPIPAHRPVKMDDFYPG
jgi:sialic acid synthase SpsE